MFAFQAVPTLDKNKALKIPWGGPRAPTNNMYLVDLFGLSLNQIFSMRKVDVYFKNGSDHIESFLEGDYQLSQTQGFEVFEHIAKMEMEQRPQGLKPTASRPPTLESLQARAAAAAENPGSPSTAMVAVEPTSPTPVPKVAGLGLGSLAKGGKGKTKAKAKAASSGKGKGAVHGVGSKPRLGDDDDEASAQQQHALEDASATGKSDRSSKKPSGFNLDEEMQQVADAHKSSGGSSSVKCLEALVPERFLLPHPDFNKYAQASTLTAVGVANRLHLIRCMVV